MRSYCDRSTSTTTNKPIEIKIETCSISECCQIHGKISSENCTDSHANTKRTTWINCELPRTVKMIIEKATWNMKHDPQMSLNLNILAVAIK